ncbi:hypothetical protein Q8A67_001471 [Cirrhinus molitorella]|uniref:Uncharacterized protein n=1 Tax=Cirrhinus molitorella TaxID=172907 RepID=A0AA88U7N0_9TELE|nr:hypothetical protein Q8A67_001470 [Cirrhinus molitorella]KAK2917097.1 hypothetical protein Q8A67_001471 [Cirrhinus molitorella]
MLTAQGRHPVAALETYETRPDDVQARDHIGSSADIIQPPQAFADGSTGVDISRHVASSRFRWVAPNPLAVVPVPSPVQKTARSCELRVIPNTPERKRPRQSIGDTSLWNEDFVQAWDDCDMDRVSSLTDNELNQQRDSAENAGDSDGDVDNLPSNQEEYKNQLQGDANNEILKFLNTVVKNQKRIIEDHQRAREEQARVNQTVTTTLQKQGIILKQIIAMQKRHDGGHEKTACDQELTVTLLNEIVEMLK